MTNPQPQTKAKRGPKPSGKPQKPLADRVRDSRAKALANGHKRMTIVLPPEAAQALVALRAAQPQSSNAACISQALIEAAKAIQ